MTIPNPLRLSENSCFNPHFRKGSDGAGRYPEPCQRNVSIHTSAREVTILWSVLWTWFSVSIHTSAREVTYISESVPLCFFSFNPHFRKGSDFYAKQLVLRHHLFQSTLPQGKWPLGNVKAYQAIMFQSTLPQGKWQMCGTVIHLLTQVSIHTSAREVTVANTTVYITDVVSIHTSAREVTFYPAPYPWDSVVSIHTSAREVTVNLLLPGLVM